MTTYNLHGAEALDEPLFDSRPGSSAPQTSWRYAPQDPQAPSPEPRGLIEHLLTMGIVFGILLAAILIFGFRVVA